MLYAIKSDTLFFNRQANRADLDAFSFLYPLADAGLIRKMEGAEITRERLDYVIKAWQQGRMMEHVFCAFLGEPPREDFIPYVADFYLQLEDVQWTVISGVVNDQMVVSVRNLGYSRNAGDFVRRWFNDIGSAGGHRTMAKAVVPLEASRKVRRPRGQPGQPADARAGARLPARAERQEVGQSSSSAWEARLVDRAGPYGNRAPGRRSAMRSAASSRPIEIRIMPRVTPARASCCVVEPVLRRQDRQAAEALDAAEAGRALDQPQPIEGAERRVLPARRGRAHHAAETAHLRRAMAWSGCDGSPGRTRGRAPDGPRALGPPPGAFALCRAIRSASVFRPRPRA